MKILLCLLFPVIAVAVRGLSTLFTVFADMLACRQIARRWGRDIMPKAERAATEDEARQILNRFPVEILAEYLIKQAVCRFLIVVGLIDGILLFIGVALQIPGIWLPLGIIMLLFSFLETMICRDGFKQAKAWRASMTQDTLSGQQLFSASDDCILISQAFRRSMERAFGKPWRVFSGAAVILAVLLAGLQADFFLRAREVESGVWQLGRYQYRLLEDGTAEIVQYTGIWKKARVPASFREAPVTSIGAQAFRCPEGDYRAFGRKEVTEVDLPDCLTCIGDAAFRYCDELARVSIPDGVEQIGNEAFSGCGELTGLKIPEKLTWIGDRAFEGCYRLADLTLPDGVVRIGDRAFSGCSGLTVMHIPDSVTEIAGNPFDGCRNLREMTISGDHPVYCILDGALCSRTGGQLIWVPYIPSKTEYRVPDGIREIGIGAFSNQEELERVILSDGVISIGENAFSDCRALKEAVIPDSVISIGKRAFSGCGSLSDVTLPSHLISLGEYAFYCCKSLEEIAIPSGVGTIGAGAFSGCEKLCRVTIQEGVTVIEHHAFSGCALASLVIPESVREIAYVFSPFPRETVLVVVPGSYAETYCERYGLEYRCPDETV